MAHHFHSLLTYLPPASLDYTHNGYCLNKLSHLRAIVICCRSSRMLVSGLFHISSSPVSFFETVEFKLTTRSRHPQPCSHSFLRIGLP